MINTEKGFAPIIILIIMLAAAVVGGGTYIAVTKKQAPISKEKQEVASIKKDKEEKVSKTVSTDFMSKTNKDILVESRNSAIGEGNIFRTHNDQGQSVEVISSNYVEGVVSIEDGSIQIQFETPNGMVHEMVDLLISGLEPNVTYYFYHGSLENVKTVVADFRGSILLTNIKTLGDEAEIALTANPL